MTDRELLDRLARDVAEALTAIADREENWAGVARSFASGIYARHEPGADSHQQQATIPPAESGGLPSEAKRWWVVDNDGGAWLGWGPFRKQYAHECAAAWDKSHPAGAPHRAILATDADDARAQYAQWRRADAAEKERDEARRKCEDAMADALHAHTARRAAERDRDEVVAQLKRSMARERYMRDLCDEAAARLRAAAVQPASEGRADG